MLNGLSLLAFLINGNGQVCMRIRVFRLDQHRGAAMGDRSVDFASFKKGMAKGVVGEEIIRSHGQCFLVMNNRLIDSLLLKKSFAQSDLSIWIIRLNHYSSLAMDDRLVDFAFLEESVAKIVICVRKIRLHLQGLPVMSNCLVNFAFLKKDDAQIIVSHPASWIFSQRHPPERFDISIHCRLSPRQDH